MKTKEKIIDFAFNLPKGDEKWHRERIKSIDKIYTAMEEYANQQSIDFVEFIVTQKVERIGSGLWEVHSLADDKTGLVPVMHTSKIYELFKSHQLNNQNQKL